jgi:hypothetical protein
VISTLVSYKEFGIGLRSVSLERKSLNEFVTSKITKVLSSCFILRPCNNGLGLLSVAVLENVFFHCGEISDAVDFNTSAVVYLTDGESIKLMTKIRAISFIFEGDLNVNL